MRYWKCIHCGYRVNEQRLPQPEGARSRLPDSRLEEFVCPSCQGDGLDFDEAYDEGAIEDEPAPIGLDLEALIADRLEKDPACEPGLEEGGPHIGLLEALQLLPEDEVGKDVLPVEEIGGEAGLTPECLPGGEDSEPWPSEEDEAIGKIDLEALPQTPDKSALVLPEEAATPLLLDLWDRLLEVADVEEALVCDEEG